MLRHRAGLDATLTKKISVQCEQGTMDNFRPGDYSPSSDLSKPNGGIATATTLPRKHAGEPPLPSVPSRETRTARASGTPGTCPRVGAAPRSRLWNTARHSRDGKDRPEHKAATECYRKQTRSRTTVAGGPFSGEKWFFALLAISGEKWFLASGAPP